MSTRQRRILWVSNHTPFLADFGGGQRSSLIYRTLRTVGDVDVLLVCPPRSQDRTIEETHGRPQGLTEIVEPLRRGELRPWRYLRGFAPSVVDRIAYNLGRREVDYERDAKVGAMLDRMLAEHHYDLIVGRHLKYPSKAGALQYGPTIIDVDDNELDLYRSLINDRHTSFFRRAVLKRRIKSLDEIVPRLLSQSTCLWVSKEEDRDLPGCERASVLSNIPYGMSLPNPPSPLPPNKASRTILFVGMLSYVYNTQGINSFIKESWPLVRQAVPDAVLRLVGSRLSNQDRERWAAVPGVDLVGFVPDLREAYRDCAFAVVPVWCGGGTNIKVLEALIYGRTCVVSRPSHRGYVATLQNIESLIVGENPENMAAHCIALLRDPDRGARLAEKGACVVSRNYSFERFQHEVIRTVESAFRICPQLIRRQVACRGTTPNGREADFQSSSVQTDEL
jgi:glycosyltransferase involved in cell wall biosynthesis